MRTRRTGAVGGRRYGRNRVIRTLHKSAKFARRIKNGAERTKNRAEETQNPRSNSPVDYAVSKVENAANKAKDRATRTAARTLRNPRKKARRQFARAREHFSEVRRLSPTERRRTTEQVQKTADIARSNADSLKTVANDAREKASKAKGAANDAKTALRQVRADGRRYIKTAKSGAARGELPSVKTSGGADRLKTRRYADKFKSRRATIKTAPQSPADIKTPTSATSAQTAAPRFTSSPAASSEQSAQGRAAAHSHAVRLRNGKTVNITRHGTAADGAASPKTGGTSSGATSSRTLASANAGNPQTPSTKIDAPNNISSNSTSANNAAPKGNATAPRQARTGYTSKPLSHTRGGAGRGVRPSNASDAVGRATDSGKFARSATTAKDAAANTERAATTAKTTKTAGRNVKQTTKGTVKTAKKTVKTAEKSAKTAVKTTKQAAKTAERSAKAAAKSAKVAEKSARVAAKTAAQAAKVAGKALVATVKATIAAVKGLVALIAAGGWVAFLVILVICMAGLLVGSVYGIFLANEQTASGKTLNGVIAEINTEYADTIAAIKDTNAGAYDLIDTSGAFVNWREVLAVYAVKTAADPANGADVASMDDIKAAILRGVFWDMNDVTYSLATIDVEEDELDADGLPTGATVNVSKTVLRISVTHRTLDEMAALYGFTDEQREMLTELLKPDYYALWNALLYGITSVGDASLVEIAATQIGNVGGELYWRWYGFTSREAWCAIFVSWCAEQAGLIQSGVIPRFSSCEDGIEWFKARNQWQGGAGGYTPNVGDLIFFDWNGDGISDHVGIVERVDGGEIHTLEGNSSDSVARRVYRLGGAKIIGYGLPRY